MSNTRWARLLTDPELLTGATAIAVALKNALLEAMQQRVLIVRKLGGDASGDLDQARLELDELCDRLSIDFAQAMNKLPPSHKRQIDGALRLHPPDVKAVA